MWGIRYETSSGGGGGGSFVVVQFYTFNATTEQVCGIAVKGNFSCGLFR